MAVHHVTLRSRLEQAARSNEPAVLQNALRWAIDELTKANPLAPPSPSRRSRQSQAPGSLSVCSGPFAC